MNLALSPLSLSLSFSLSTNKKNERLWRRQQENRKQTITKRFRGDDFSVISPAFMFPFSPPTRRQSIKKKK
jgi:hypothetical protein